MYAATMTHQQASAVVGQSSECGRNIPVRSLVACRFDSASSVSTLSLGSDFDRSTVVSSRSLVSSRGPSLPRIDRFKASGGSGSGADRGLGKAPGRKGSIHKLNTSDHGGCGNGGDCDHHHHHDDGGCALPPRLPNRQLTADRKKNVFADAMKDDRPGLQKESGGINLFGSS